MNGAFKNQFFLNLKQQPTLLIMCAAGKKEKRKVDAGNLAGKKEKWKQGGGERKEMADRMDCRLPGVFFLARGSGP